MVGYREKCLSVKGEECAVCGSQDDIVVHHLNANRADDSLDNLLPVCRIDHAKIHAGHPDLASYVAYLPNTNVRSIQKGGRTTISANHDAFQALEQHKRDNESWNEFCFRAAEALTVRDVTVAPDSSVDEVATMIGERAVGYFRDALRDGFVMNSIQKSELSKLDLRDLVD